MRLLPWGEGGVLQADNRGGGWPQQPAADAGDSQQGDGAVPWRQSAAQIASGHSEAGRCNCVQLPEGRLEEAEGRLEGTLRRQGRMEVEGRNLKQLASAGH